MFWSIVPECLIGQFRRVGSTVFASGDCFVGKSSYCASSHNESGLPPFTLSQTCSKLQEGFVTNERAEWIYLFQEINKGQISAAESMD